MAAEWLQFGAVAALLLGGLICFVGAATGALRFGYVLNRIHAAGVGDSLGMLLVVAALTVSAGPGWDSLKLWLIVGSMWLTSPVSAHFLGQVEYFTNPRLYDHVRREPAAAADEEVDGV